MTAAVGMTRFESSLLPAIKAEIVSLIEQFPFSEEAFIEHAFLTTTEMSVETYDAAMDELIESGTVSCSIWGCRLIS